MLFEKKREKKRKKHFNPDVLILAALSAIRVKLAPGLQLTQLSTKIHLLGQ